MTNKTSESKTPRAGSAPPTRNRNVDRTKVHLDIFERRLQGGAPATPEAYANAIEQWQRLPGAIIEVPLQSLTTLSVMPADINRMASASDAPDQERQS